MRRASVSEKREVGSCLGRWSGALSVCGRPLRPSVSPAVQDGLSCTAGGVSTWTALVRGTPRSGTAKGVEDGRGAKISTWEGFSGRIQ